MNNCTYNKVKLMHKLGKISWFIEKFGKDDASKAGDDKCSETLKDIQTDIEKHVKALNNSMK